MKNPKLISQGAEAKIYLDTRTDTPTIIKHRLKKSYRHPQLDEQIRKKRTKSEAKILIKAKEAGVNVPIVLNKDEKGRNMKIALEEFGDNKSACGSTPNRARVGGTPNSDDSNQKPEHTLIMQFINGERLSETLNKKPEKEQFKIMQALGKQVAKLHENNIIHGDLTTSNVILASNNFQNIPVRKNKPKPSPRNEADTKSSAPADFSRSENCKNTRNEVSTISQKVFIIDFGLGFISTKIEDKAVDLHLIKQALEAKHFQNHEDLFKNFLKSYQHNETEKVLKQLEKVEARGRYKH